jgi:hypothetical protein
MSSFQNILAQRPGGFGGTLGVVLQIEIDLHRVRARNSPRTVPP